MHIISMCEIYIRKSERETDRETKRDKKKGRDIYIERERERQKVSECVCLCTIRDTYILFCVHMYIFHTDHDISIYISLILYTHSILLQRTFIIELV